MNLCKSCNQKIEQQVKFCPYCGTNQTSKTERPVEINQDMPKADVGLKLALYIGLALLIVIALIVVMKKNSGNINTSQSTNSYSAASSVKSRLEQGIEYTWYSDGSCSSRDGTVCLSFQDYKELCDASQGLTKNASGVLGMFQPGYRDLVEGGDISNIRTYWATNYKHPCRVTITVSGIYRGTSKRITADGGVTTFILNRQNELLVHHASDMNF